MKLLTNGLTDIDSFMDKNTRRDGVKLIASYFNLTSVLYLVGMDHIDHLSDCF